MKDLLAARERFAPNPPVHVVVRKEDIDPSRLGGRVVIVLDILFATTTIITALEAGAESVIPAEDQHEARRIAATLPVGEFHIAGEEQLAAIDGFATPLPLELSRTPGLSGRPLVYSTTNGTVALRRAQGAKAIYAAALRNVSATLAHIRTHHAGLPLLIVCAGSSGALNLEDFYAAGCFVSLLGDDIDPARDLSDTALAALAVFRNYDPATALSASRVGRIVRGAGSPDEVSHAAQIDASKLVAVLDGDRVVRV
ncbi:MAG: 2-phosphosulfolactate phosphatase [Betaproteobacteria bacterium]